jgi:hypothetical protein
VPLRQKWRDKKEEKTKKLYNNNIYTQPFFGNSLKTFKFYYKGLKESVPVFFYCPP